MEPPLSAKEMPLTAYLHAGWEPLIRPASPRREWMDNTPESFAARCLPLNIANAHGWEVLTPMGFNSYWKGGSGTENVIIEADAGMPPASMPISLFGQGTFTVHVQALIRTPPGYDLFVTGSPNWAKDGIAPLSGVVETDWSPYTFTMNWRFTRINQWVRWEAQEPVAFLFPVQRGLLERMEPRFVALDQNPDAAKQFADWSASRNAFHEEMRNNPPNDPSKKWQKLYYRGQDMRGRRMATHLSKLRLKPFREAM